MQNVRTAMKKFSLNKKPRANSKRRRLHRANRGGGNHRHRIFRTDVGCHLDGIFVGSRYFAREESDLSKLALAALGWEKASKSERENLANIWVEKGLLVFAPLSNQSLSAISTGDGNVKVTASSKYPAGVTSRSVSKVFVFNQEGGLESGSGY